MAHKGGVALIIGVGDGLSASLARLLAKEGYKLALASRRVEKLDALAKDTKAKVYRCDASDPAQVTALFKAVGDHEVMIYNPSYRIRGPFIELDPAEVKKALEITAFGAFLAGQQATRNMLPRGRGTIMFTGASAGVKGYAQSAPFAMGKFALRGLAQSMARELHPRGIHVAHIVVDGGIRSSQRPDGGNDNMLNPDSIARSYLHLLHQPRDSWSWEIEVRPWVETF
jgi:NAD(P)-dependent dehydrogenase (short-subunit alcohol dehydrogenase family)